MIRISKGIGFPLERINIAVLLDRANQKKGKMD